MTTSPVFSLRRRLGSIAMFLFGFAAVGIFLVSAHGAGLIGGSLAETRSQSELGDTADSIRPAVTGSPTYVFEQHAADCWTAAETRSTLPAAAIVQATGGPTSGLTFHTDDPDVVDAAFSEVLHDIGFDAEPTSRTFRVIALCAR